MVGKSNVPSDTDQRDGAHAIATPTPGLVSALDEERAGSMADEGGSSGAWMESELDPTWAQTLDEYAGDDAVDRSQSESFESLRTWRLLGLVLACGIACAVCGAAVLVAD